MLAGLAWRAWLWLKHWHHNRYRREALRELECLKPDSRELNFVAALNALLKRTALAVYPRQRVAALNGQEWIAFLQGECDAQAFDNSSAALLTQGSYKIEPIAEDQAQALLAAAARWIREHRGVER